jgi:hypothetical protein
MLLIIRIFLVSLIIYLIFRAFSRYSMEEEKERENNVPGNNNQSRRKISKEIGEYIDFEEDDK